jgi:hypothetical protein
MTEIKLPDLILDSIELGMNKKLMLLATGIDEETFDHKVEYDNFDPESVRKLRNIIKEWRKANAIF